MHESSAQPNSYSELIEKVANIYKQAYDSGATYAKTLIGLGFAAVLTVWAKTQDLLSSRQRPAVALLICFSLFFYVSFEVLQMMLLGWLRTRLHSQIAKTTNLGAAIQQHERAVNKLQPWLNRCWYVSLVLTVLPGFTGAGILIYAFVRSLFR